MQKTVWVIGAGQLGNMLQYAGAPLGIHVHPINVDDDAIAVPHLHNHHVVTAERERWPDTPAARALQQHPHFVNRDVFATLADRKSQKSLLDHLHLATARWMAVNESTSESELHTKLGDTVLLKRRTGGYDGRGQHWLRSGEHGGVPAGWHNEAIAEEKIPFREEVSLIGARCADGSKIFYPLTLNLHVDGILMASVSPLPRLAHLQGKAESMLGAILDELAYVGVMGMECFHIDDRLVINELAPRVHNSGHWTQAGASISQFEAHLRAICALPLPVPLVRDITVMINLVGVDRDDRWLHIPEAQLHWYNKDVRAGRKVGHINLNNADDSSHQLALDRLREWLPERYAAVLDWASEALTGRNG